LVSMCLILSMLFVYSHQYIMCFWIMLLLLLCFKLLSYFNMIMFFFFFFFLQILFFCLYMHFLLSDLKAHWRLCCNVWCFPTLNKYCIVINKTFYSGIQYLILSVLSLCISAASDSTCALTKDACWTFTLKQNG
jgi:hypothetical protein